VIEIPFILENSSESGSLNQHRVGYLKLLYGAYHCIAIDTKLETAEINERGHKKMGAKKCTRRDSTLRLLYFLNCATSAFITVIEACERQQIETAMGGSQSRIDFIILKNISLHHKTAQ